MDRAGRARDPRCRLRDEQACISAPARWFDAAPADEGRMLDAMGILRTTIAIEHPARRGTRIELSDVIVDTGSEYTWVPQPVLESIGLAPERVVDFVTSDGRQIERGVGFANIYAAGTSTPDIVVFAGVRSHPPRARTLDGPELRVDLSAGHWWQPAGPAASCQSGTFASRSTYATRSPISVSTWASVLPRLEDVKAVVGAVEPVHRPLARPSAPPPSSHAGEASRVPFRHSAGIPIFVRCASRSCSASRGAMDSESNNRRSRIVGGEHRRRAPAHGPSSEDQGLGAQLLPRPRHDGLHRSPQHRHRVGPSAVPFLVEEVEADDVQPLRAHDVRDGEHAAIAHVPARAVCTDEHAR